MLPCQCSKMRVLTLTCKTQLCIQDTYMCFLMWSWISLLAAEGKRVVICEDSVSLVYVFAFSLVFQSFLHSCTETG